MGAPSTGTGGGALLCYFVRPDAQVQAVQMVRKRGRARTPPVQGYIIPLYCFVSKRKFSARETREKR